jgi:DNA-binding SARP family transcriptional activator
VADDEAMAWVDLALRYLSGLVEQLSFDGVTPVPSLVLVRVGPSGLEVVLSPPPDGRLGWFSPKGEGSAHVLDADIDLEDLRALAEERWPAWPALVSLGRSEGSTLLFNLEHAGSLSVEGPAARVEGALAAIAIQLGSQPWCDEMLAGLFTTGQSPLPKIPGALRHVDNDSTLDLAERLDQVATNHQEGAVDIALSTLRAVACEALPNVAVAFAETPPGALLCLAEAAVPERSGVALVGAGPYPGARWRLVLGTGTQACLEGETGEGPARFELTISPDRQEVSLLSEEVRLLSEALGATSDRTGATAGHGPGLEAPDLGLPPVVQEAGSSPVGEDGDLAHHGPGAGGDGPERGEVEICVLGPVDIIGGDPDAVETSRRMAVLAVLAYMVVHPRPVTADELASNLWPLDATRDDLGGPQRKTVMNVVSRARALLGYGLGAKDRLVYSPMGYRLNEEVTSDWGRFERLVARSRREGTAEARASLRLALELVRGEPFGGAISSQFFEWVASEHLDMTLAAKVVDVAQDLAEMALQAGDFPTATWAVDKGLQLEPTREELFRLWMHALGQSGRPAKVDEVYRRLKLILRQKVHPLQEPQAESRNVWRRYTVSEVASTG